MPKKPARTFAQSLTLAHTLKEIEAKSQVVNELATKLSSQIEAFENWLNELPGKVQAESWISESPEYSFGIRLERASSRWRLHYGHFYEHADPSIEVDWNLLADASVDRKILAIEMFPQLVIAIAEAQETRIKAIKQASSDFDNFAKVIGLAQTQEEE